MWIYKHRSVYVDATTFTIKENFDFIRILLIFSLDCCGKGMANTRIICYFGIIDSHILMNSKWNTSSKQKRNVNCL